MKTRKYVESKALGIQVAEKIAPELDRIVSGLPQELRIAKRLNAVCKSEGFAEGETAAVATISTKGVDLEGDVIEPEGIDLSLYKSNPIVLFNHDPERPIGHCAWIRANDEGVKAKVCYARRPEGWVGGWFAQEVYELTKQGVLKGMSIGFIPLKIDDPDEKQKAIGCKRYISQALLFEFSSVSLPCNPAALVESVSKGISPALLKELGLTKPKIVVPVPKPKKLIVEFLSKANERVDALLKKVCSR